MASEPAPPKQAKANGKPQPTAGHVDAISEMFTQFQLAYHNQFHKAFANDEQITMAKQLWLRSLSDLSPEQIRLGTQRIIRESTFLPNLHSIREYCQPPLATLGLPQPHAAYIEACRAASPKTEQDWSHPAVYLAGKASDWYFLASNTEAVARPVFERNYQIFCERVINGEQLAMPEQKAIPEKITKPLNSEEQQQRMAAMRKELGI